MAWMGEALWGKVGLGEARIFFVVGRRMVGPRGAVYGGVRCGKARFFMDYPTKRQVEAADRTQLARWTRFLSSPTEEQLPILNRIIERFNKLGGMTTELSKLIGF